MERLSALLIAMAVLVTPATVNAAEKGILTGGQVYDLPDWFMHGFLEFDYDVAEAKKTGKQVIAFFPRGGVPVLRAHAR